MQNILAYKSRIKNVRENGIYDRVRCVMQSVQVKSRLLLVFAATVLTVTVSGCVEFSHFGQVSDRESSSSIAGVSVEQQQSDGSWKHVGDSDGKGRFNIFRDKIKSGGNVRLSKTGYSTVIMAEQEFLQQTNVLMTPTGETQNFGDDSAAHMR